MQYVGKVGGYVYNQWNSLNPATLSGAIDIIVIEHADGLLHCLPWHVRFGKFRIIKPLQKKIDLYVNGRKTDMPMKLGDGGEAFFVFETDLADLSLLLMTSPVISALSLPEMSPALGNEALAAGEGMARGEPELLDLNHDAKLTDKDLEQKISLLETPLRVDHLELDSDSLLLMSRLTFEKVKRITQDLNIPLKIDVNGDVILDMDGYKPNLQKNIDLSDKLVHSIFLKEMNSILHGNEWLGHESKDSDSPEMRLLQSLIKKDDDGQIRLVYDDTDFEDAETAPLTAPLTIPSEQAEVKQSPVVDSTAQDKTYIKTLRLTLEQLQNLGLQYGRNSVVFRLPQGGSQVEADLYLWKLNIPIVISDIDGTITKSDALGHVLNMFGRDWTHPGVANLFQDITRNGYNILYLTARSVGQADTTRQYLDSINQDGMRLPKGPVILSPDRTMAALRREIILKKPEVFKMACLRDINSLFFTSEQETLGEDIEDERTPFYAGFGNRITDAISYRSVKIPSHRIFTINPNGEVHMELLELAGYRLLYLHIGELVDQFFPPLKYISDFSQGWNQDQLDQYIHSKDNTDENVASPGSPRLPMSPGLPRSVHLEDLVRPDERFTDLNYWREPLANLSDLSDSDDDDTDAKSVPPSPKPLSPPVSPRLGSSEKQAPRKERPVSASFTSPLKNFMIRGNNLTAAPKPMKSPLHLGPGAASGLGSSDAHDGIDEDDDYTDDDYEDEEDEDDEDDEDDDEEDEDDEDDAEDDDEIDDEAEEGESEEDEESEESHPVEKEEIEEEEAVDAVADEDDDEYGDEDEDEVDHEEMDDQLDQEVDDDDLDLDDGLPNESPAPVLENHALPEKFLAPAETERSALASSELPVEYEGEDYRIMTASDMLKGLDI